MSLLLNLEYYPEIPQSVLIEAAKIIQSNMKKWAEPFFMDVYAHADLEKFKETCKIFTENKNLKNLIILGTGGSIQTAYTLSGLFNLKLYAVVSSRPKELHEVLKATSPEDSIVVPISRGGKTLDVNSTIELFKDYPMFALSSKGPMYEFISKKDIPILPVPDLSGRFAASVCSVGLIPAILAGLDIDQFLQSLTEAYTVYKDFNASTSESAKNLAFEYAVYLKLMYNNGYRNVFNMPYSAYLEGVTGLLVQEISESTGKEGAGLLGTSQPAPLCQHSVLELLLGGSKGHTTPLLWTTESEPSDDIAINNEDFGLKMQTALGIINHQADATFQALLAQGVPSSKVSLKSIDVPSLAHAIAFVQSTVYYLCLLFDVNWESNPLVNTGKKICNEAIAQNKDQTQRRADRALVAKKHLNEIKFNL